MPASLKYFTVILIIVTVIFLSSGALLAQDLFSGMVQQQAPQKVVAKEEFTMSGSVIEGYKIFSNGETNAQPDLRGTIVDSGEINWEYYIPPTDMNGRTEYPSGWVSIISCDISDDKMTMKFTVPSIQYSQRRSDRYSLKNPTILVFTKGDSSQNTNNSENQQAPSQSFFSPSPQ